MLVQYVTIRAFRPEIVVETGGANGVSSSYLLLAMGKNAAGRLHSIDIGESSYLPPGKTTGWIVPQFLKHRWDFRIGDSKVLLPRLLAELRATDVFIYDSLRSTITCFGSIAPPILTSARAVCFFLTMRCGTTRFPNSSQKWAPGSTRWFAASDF